MKVGFFFIFLFSYVFLFSQTKDDWALICNKSDQLDKQHIPLHSPVRLNSSGNITRRLLFLPLFFYQKFLSEQLSSNCEFEMSCSNFSIASIKEFGVLKGIALTADRLTRCNGQTQFETEDYLINHKKGKTIDEPSMYHFKD